MTIPTTGFIAALLIFYTMGVITGIVRERNQ